MVGKEPKGLAYSLKMLTFSDEENEKCLCVHRTLHTHTHLVESVVRAPFFSARMTALKSIGETQRMEEMCVSLLA